MVTFVALYRGRTLGTARLVAAIEDSQTAQNVAEKILDRYAYSDVSDDSVSIKLREGERAALLEVIRESNESRA